MDTQSIGYKAKAFEARNLAIFVLVIVGITGVGVGSNYLPAGCHPGFQVLFWV